MKFRAISKHNQEVVEGYLIKDSSTDEWCIIEEDNAEWIDGREWNINMFHEVDYSTVVLINE